MARRLKPTLIDYVVIAINPALIMVLIGSLVYFLLEMFYQGQYPERLHVCLSLFVFAAVLIGRISIEEGWERASMFALPLFVVIVLAMLRFVTYRNSQLAVIGWLINLGLIAITWWFAHMLTWDCTVIDEAEDASGEGLLETSRTGRLRSRCCSGTSSAQSGRSHRRRQPIRSCRQSLTPMTANRGGSGMSSGGGGRMRRACGSFTFRSPRCRCSAWGRRSFRSQTSAAGAMRSDCCASTSPRGLASC